MAAAPAFTVASLVATAVPAAIAAPRADAIQLIDQAGRRFALRDLRGRPFAVTFIASRCTDACPIIDAQFALVQRRLAALRSPAQLVTITLDPGYDTPFVMARLAHDYAADPRRWRLASGTMRDVTRCGARTVSASPPTPAASRTSTARSSTSPAGTARSESC